MELRDITEQLDALTDRYDELCKRTKYDDLSGGTPRTDAEVVRLCVRTIAACERLLPPDYRDQAEAPIARWRGGRASPGKVILSLLEVLRAFREDAEAGFLRELEASINAGVFADFLEMAEHVLAEIHRTPAAVIASFTLEEHLRKMCARAGIPITRDDGTHIKADALNAELSGVGAYGDTAKTEAKDVTAWLGRRNDAAHGHHDRYSDEQVALMIEGVRGFISRHPA